MVKSLNQQPSRSQQNALKDRIEACIVEYGTNSWEDEFLESILFQVKAGRTLSPSQMQKLEDIEEKLENPESYWEDRVGGGG